MKDTLIGSSGPVNILASIADYLADGWTIIDVEITFSESFGLVFNPLGGVQNINKIHCSEIHWILNAKYW